MLSAFVNELELRSTGGVPSVLQQDYRVQMDV